MSVAAVVLWSTGTVDLDVASVRGRVEAAGATAPLLFVGAYAALTLLPVPKNILSVAAGAVFGLGGGVALVWLAAMLGALLAFAMARAVDPSALNWATGRHRERVGEVLRHHGTSAVVVARLVPLAPFTAVNYISGMSSLRVRDYVLGTAVGIIPGTVVYVAVGAVGLDSPGRLGVAVAALGALVLCGGAWARRLRRDRVEQGGATSASRTAGEK